MNVLDKIYTQIAPERALKRQLARKKLEIFNQGYGDHGASGRKKSLMGWLTNTGSVLEDVETHIPTLRERSRDLYMGAPLATGALKTIRTNVIGPGLKVNPQIDYEFLKMTQEEAEEWSIKTEREFRHWSSKVHCDAQRMNNFYELQQLAFLSWMMSGDCFALLPVIPRKNCVYDLRINIIEADRVCTPPGKTEYGKVINGVEINENGEVVAYHIADKHPGSSIYNGKENKWTKIDKFGELSGRQNVIHLMESERPEQRRGVPILSPVIESLKQLSRYSEAELMAAVVTGMYTIFITSKTPEESPMGEGIPEEDRIEGDENSYQLGNGTMIALAEGEDIKEANPLRPNTAFDGFVTAVCRQIGSALELPYEMLLKHFTASYSASRAAMLEAWKMFKMRRSWMASDFCQPIYEEWLTEAVAKGRISAPGFLTDPLVREAYCAAEWNGPSQGQLDPLKEVNAAARRVQEAFSTRERETVELTGGDFKKNVRQRKNEEKMMKEGGLIADELVGN